MCGHWMTRTYHQNHQKSKKKNLQKQVEAAMDATTDEAPAEKGEKEEMFQRNSVEPGP